MPALPRLSASSVSNAMAERNTDRDPHSRFCVVATAAIPAIDHRQLINNRRITFNCTASWHNSHTRISGLDGDATELINRRERKNQRKNDRIARARVQFLSQCSPRFVSIRFFEMIPSNYASSSSVSQRRYRRQSDSCWKKNEEGK